MTGLTGEEKQNIGLMWPHGSKELFSFHHDMQAFRIRPSGCDSLSDSLLVLVRAREGFQTYQ